MAGFPKYFPVFQRSDYTVSTWLLLGASIQCLLVASLPRNISLLPPIAFLVFRVLRCFLTATGRLPNPLANDVIHGRQTWMIPNSDNDSTTTGASESIVVLVLAASWSHPNGMYSPGSQEIGGYFASMWQDAEANREKYGYLGRTPSMCPQESDAGPDSQGKTLVTLSYWKSLEGLHKFAHGTAHMKGQLWWEKGAMDQFPHLGVMHETYEVPKGNWENVYHNFRPFGLSNAKYPVPRTVLTDGSEKQASVEWVSGLQPVDKREWKTMYGRMGRRAGARFS